MLLRILRKQYPDVYIWPRKRFFEDFGTCPFGRWYRSPSWADHVIWNRRHGFQDYVTVGRGNVVNRWR